MKNNFALCIVVLCACRLAAAQGYGIVEQYVYVSEDNPPTYMPIAQIQNKNWYGEARYNYEKLKSLSVYAGRVYSFKNKRGSHSSSLIPIAGIVIGKFKGGSVGFNLKVKYTDLFLTSQSQYTFSIKDQHENFTYSWSELGYQPWYWIYGGLAVQKTNLFQENRNRSETEVGVVVGFVVGQWTIPLYSFSPLAGDRYFVVGLNFDYGTNGKDIR